MKLELIPAVLAHDAEEAERKSRLVAAECPWMQLDIVDGVFAPNLTWHDPALFASWNLNVSLELDLMVQDPDRAIREWQSVPNLKRVLWHVEVEAAQAELIRRWKDHGLEVGLSLNPQTAPETLLPYLNLIDCALILGVQPGFSGQKLIRSSIEHARRLRKLAPHLPIEFDGGIQEELIDELVAAGVTRACMSSAIFDHAHPERAIRRIRERLDDLDRRERLHHLQ